jgi:hypothetical protein
MSKSRVITPNDDNYGFAEWVKLSAEAIENLLLLPNSVTYGEWCGPGIQNGVACSRIPERTWFVFRVDADPDTVCHSYVCEFPSRVQLIPELAHIEIDFTNPEPALEYLRELVQQVEARDPVIAELYGIDGVGEGVVATPLDSSLPFNDFAFKVKGGKHQVKREPKLVVANAETLATVGAFVEAFVTRARVMQGLTELGLATEPFDRNAMGEVLRWVSSDVFKESEREREACPVAWKVLNRAITDKVKSLLVIDAF